ncbi:hypothetical protein [Bacillus mycoides]|uniref:hypothetical protein n=1 Tax=Bacillus mycoides TaxID=1405 RepID=UPI0027345C22|nr:hypothetical protein [Bacillus mycoides]
MDIRRFTNYYSKKMKHNLTKKKRVKTIAEYFSKKEKKNISFADEEECYTYIVRYTGDREEEGEEILEELFMLLEYEYSTQNPNYVFDLETNMTHNDFYKLISQILKGSVRYGDFEYRQTNNIRYDTFNEVIECDLDYKEYALDMVKEKEYRKTSGPINITFDLKNKKFISSKSKNYKNHNNLVNFLNTKGLKISPIYILKRALTIKNQNFTEFSPTTLLIINLLYEKIPEMGYDITLDAISFTNLDSENIKGVKIKGTNLLEANEVLERIHFGDEVHTLKLTLDIIHNNNGTQQYFTTTFTIDLRGKIVFIFNDDENRESRKREICIKLQESLINLIYDERTIANGEKIIHERLSKPKSIHQIVSDIQKSVMELIKEDDNKIKVEQYFIENHPASFNS